MKSTVGMKSALFFAFTSICCMAQSTSGSDTNHKILVEPVLTKAVNASQNNTPTKTTESDPNPTATKFVKRMQERIYRNWEPGNVETKTSLILYEVDKTTGAFSNISTSISSGDCQNDFACEEAVRESSGCFKNTPLRDKAAIGTPFIFKMKSTTFNCAKSFRDKQSIHSNNVIVHHFIPLETLNCIEGIDPTFIHSDNNLRLISITTAHSIAFQNLQDEWLSFLRSEPKPSISEVIKQSKKLEKKYNFLFESQH